MEYNHINRVIADDISKYLCFIMKYSIHIKHTGKVYASQQGQGAKTAHLTKQPLPYVQSLWSEGIGSLPLNLFTSQRPVYGCL